MSHGHAAGMGRTRLGRAALERGVAVLTMLLVWQALLLGAAGSFGWWRAWVYFAASLALVAVNLVVLARFNPEVIAARGERRSGTKGFDRVFAGLYGPLYLALPIVAGFDAVRFGWSTLPAWTVAPGVLLLVVGGGAILWAMAVNPFLETRVRIQEDRGHAVVTHGPYRIVRHPFYLGMLTQLVAAPLLLGSNVAFVVVGLTAGLLVARTILEDRVLRRELPGYAEYAERTRYRLVPGVW